MVTSIESRFLKDDKFPRRRLTLTVEIDALDYDATKLHAEVTTKLAEWFHYTESTLIVRP